MEFIRRDLETLAAAYMRQLMELQIEQEAGTEDAYEWLEARLNLIRDELGQEAYSAAVREVLDELEGVFISGENRGVRPRWRW